ncbi:MAG: Na+/H+ antiporter subunit C [Pseudomonadota bacterium]
METIVSILIGAIFAGAVYLMLSGNLFRFLLGLILISNAANLTIFAAGRLTQGQPALVPEGADAPLEMVANALPQALVLTAIVIGFGLYAFALVLTFRAYKSLGTLEVDDMRIAEPQETSK